MLPLFHNQNNFNYENYLHPICSRTRFNRNHRNRNRYFLNHTKFLMMKTTIYSILSNMVMLPAEVTAETERSYVGYNGYSEFCHKKEEEGITWFWTKEEAEAEVKFRTSPDFRMQELRKELEQLEKTAEV